MLAYLFLACGLILVLATFKKAWRVLFPPEFPLLLQETLETEAPPHGGEQEEQLSPQGTSETLAEIWVQLLARQEEILKGLEAVTTLLVQEREKLEKKITALREPRSLEEESLFQKVRAAYAQGEDLEKIARTFNRGKGEIELILNLPR